MKKQRVFIIGGPTASGKSSFAIQLAERCNGEIVNGDAIQVYQDLRILSARPSIADEQKVPHHLFGYVDAWTTPAITDWLKNVAETVPSIQNPIIVGGTGMYLDALINGISPIPDVPDKIRQQVRKMPLNDVQKQVKDCFFTDPQRMRRALEVQLATGHSLVYFQKLQKIKYLDAEFIELTLLPDREIVYRNCETRYQQMIKEGVIQEVADLMNKNPTGGVLKAIGVQAIKQYLDKEIDEKEMANRVVTATRQYAKRQMTWFRHHGHPQYIITNPKNFDFNKITK